MNKHISILIPVRDEEDYIGRCLNSIVNGAYPLNKINIIVIDGLSKDKTPVIVKDFSQKYDNIYLITNQKQITPVAINLGIEKSKGDYIFISGAHSVYSEIFFTKLVYWAEKLNAECVGGILNTETLADNSVSNAIKFVLTNKWGVGNALFRTGVKEVMEVDTVAYGCYRKDVFSRFGIFNENLTRNQDIEFNLRIKNGGGKIFLVPDVSSIYYARNTFLELARNNYSNGLWNMYTIYYSKSFTSLSLRHFIPFLFLLSIILPIIGSLFVQSFILLSLIVIFIYIITLSINCLVNLTPKTNFFAKLWAFIVLHFSYGFGSLMGIFSLLRLIYKK